MGKSIEVPFWLSAVASCQLLTLIYFYKLQFCCCWYRFTALHPCIISHFTLKHLTLHEKHWSWSWKSLVYITHWFYAAIFPNVVVSLKHICWTAKQLQIFPASVYVCHGFAFALLQATMTSENTCHEDIVMTKYDPNPKWVAVVTLPVRQQTTPIHYQHRNDCWQLINQFQQLHRFDSEKMMFIKINAEEFHTEKQT